MKSEKWRQKWLTQEYRKGSRAIDFRDVTRFVPGWVCFRWPKGIVRGNMQLDYGALHMFWPQTMTQWSNGEDVTKEDRLDIVAALQERAHDAGAKLEIYWSGP